MQAKMRKTREPMVLTNTAADTIDKVSLVTSSGVERRDKTSTHSLPPQVPVQD